MSYSGKWAGMTWLLVAMLGLAQMGMSAVEGVETEGWSAANNYQASVVGGEDGMVTVSFPPQSSPPDVMRVDLVAGGTPETSVFAGNYTAGGIKTIRFKIMCANDGATFGELKVILRGVENPNGRLWEYDVKPQVSLTGGEWAEVTVPLVREEGWSGPPRNAATYWEADMQTVQLVGIRISSSGMAAQAVTVDDFILAGDGFTTDPANLTPLQQQLEARFGVTSIDDLTAAQRAQDTDGDGMTDLNEILAGTNPDDRNAVFAAQIVSANAEGVTIKWKCVAGKKYTVSRSASLTSPAYQAVMGAIALEATADGEMEYTDTDVSGTDAFFYRVRVQ